MPAMSRALALIALVLGACALTYQGWDMFARTPPRLMLQGADDSYYYFWVRSAVVDRDLDFRNDLAQAPTLTESARARAQAEPLTDAGRVRNKYPLGWALATLPFFLVGHVLALLSGSAADGWQPVYFVVIWLGHLGYTVLGLLAARRVLAHYLPRDAANVGLWAGWLLSPLLYYQTAKVSMAHGLAFTCFAVVSERTLALMAAPNRRSIWIAGGAAAGLLLITRPTCAPYLLFPAVLIGRLVLAPATRSSAARHGPWALASALALLALPLVAQHHLTGAWRIDTYDHEPFHFADPQLWASLFSPHHGWFYWHPGMLIGIALFGVGVWRRQLPWEWVVSLAVVTYVNASWWCWWWGSSFGNRAFEGATLFAMAGWGLLWAATSDRPWARRVVTTALLLGLAANATLLALYLSNAISRGDPVTYAEMVAALLAQLARVFPG